MSFHLKAARRLRLRLVAAAACAVGLIVAAGCKRELHRRQGSVLVTGDGWGEIAPCG